MVEYCKETKTEMMKMTRLEKAKDILQSGNHTCVICNGEDVHTTELRGVKPLVQWLKSGIDFGGCYAADKVVGKGAGFLYVLLGARAVYAGVISKPALDLLQCHGIDVVFEKLVDNIINRQGTGICPFEQAVSHIDDAQKAYSAILQKMEEMNISID